MIRFILKLFKKTHICWYNKPIVSRYITFGTRQIVYECRCGNRKAEKQYFGFDEEFPIITTPFLTEKDINKFLKKEL